MHELDTETRYSVGDSTGRELVVKFETRYSVTDSTGRELVVTS